MTTFTRKQVLDAVNRAADVVAEMEWDGDSEDGRDGANLVVNLAMSFLDDPPISTEAAIRLEYDDSVADYLIARLPESTTEGVG